MCINTKINRALCKLDLIKLKRSRSPAGVSLFPALIQSRKSLSDITRHPEMITVHRDLLGEF